jgi:hypothetical protein
MVMAKALLLPLLATPALIAQTDLSRLLSRVSEEASVFQQNIPKALTQETLEQRAAMPPSRFRPRIGTSVNVVEKPRLQIRQIVSEYSVGTLRGSDSNDLVEFRQVISVDGRPVQTVEHASRALSLGMQSADGRLRKRMLEDFAKNGLVDIATDYGLILLAFTKRGLENMQIAAVGEAQIGADAAYVLRWKQTSEAGGELEFHGRQAARRAMEGTLWIRKSDGLPLRVEASVQHTDRDHHSTSDLGTIEYVQSTHGFLTPVSVVHRHIVDNRLITENLYRYEPFKLFSSDAEIKFTEIPDTPPAPKK